MVEVLSVLSGLFSALAISVSIYAVRATQRIDRESKTLAVWPSIVPCGFETTMGPAGTGDSVRVTAIRNDGRGPGHNLRLRTYSVKDGALGPLDQEVRMPSVPLGELPLPNDNNAFGFPLKSPLGTDKATHNVAILLEYEDALGTQYRERFDVMAGYGNAQAVVVKRVTQEPPLRSALSQRKVPTRADAVNKRLHGPS